MKTLILKENKNKHLFKFIRELNGDDINKDNPNYKNYKLNNIKQLIYNHSDGLRPYPWTRTHLSFAKVAGPINSY